MNTAIIYKIHFSNTSKVYIGSTIDLESRRSTHIRELRKGVHKNAKLQNYYNKHKELPQIDIIDQCEEIYRFKVEQGWINKFNSMIDGFNISPAEGSLSKQELDNLKELSRIKQKLEQREALMMNSKFKHSYLVLLDLLKSIKLLHRTDVISIKSNLFRDCRLLSASSNKLIKSFCDTVPVLVECVQTFIKTEVNEHSNVLYVAGKDFGYSFLKQKKYVKSERSLGDLLMEDIISDMKFKNIKSLVEVLKEDYDSIDTRSNY